MAHRHEWLKWTRVLEYCTSCLVTRPVRLKKIEYPAWDQQDGM